MMSKSFELVPGSPESPEFNDAFPAPALAPHAYDSSFRAGQGKGLSPPPALPPLPLVEIGA